MSAAGGATTSTEPLFCCYGCVLVHQIAGARSERGDPSFILARLGLATFLSMNVMGLSMALYAGDPSAAPAPGTVDPLHLGMTEFIRYALLLFSAPVALLLAWPILERGARGLGRRGTGVDTLIALGALAAFGLSAWATVRGSGAVYFETACMTLVLVTLGRYLEAQARSRAARSLRALVESRDRRAWVLRDGVVVEVPSDEVRPGETVRVTAGSTFPVDGVVLDGEGGVDESSLTGESVPLRKRAGAAVFAGTMSLDGSFLVRATATGPDRTSARIARLLDRARAARAPIERLADRLAGAFAPAAVAASLATLVWWGARAGAGAGLMHGLTVLLIACPCALGLATPLAVWTAIGLAAHRGIVIRSGEALERLASARSIFFDKTGTLTEGAPALTAVVAAAGEREGDVLAAAAALEVASGHPLARAVVRAARERGVVAARARGVRIHPGVGVEGEVALEGGVFRRIAIGGAEMLRRLGLDPRLRDEAGAAEGGPEPYRGPAAAVVADGRAIGTLLFRERLRPGAAEAVDALRHDGLDVTVLTGDGLTAAQDLGRRLGVRVRAGLDPEAKAATLGRSERNRGPAIMVGEGLNDAPALARASLAVALGCGDDVSREAADVSLLRDDLRQIPWLVRLARRTVRVVRVNLFWAFAYNVILIPLAMGGRLQPILAALAMVGSSLFVVGNSMRLGRAEAGPPVAARPAAAGAPRIASAEAR